MKNILMKATIILQLARKIALYKIKWIDNGRGEAGYYAIKRKMVWFVILPLNLSLAIFYATIMTISDIFDYDIHYVRSNKKEKLTFKRKLSMLINLTS